MTDERIVHWIRAKYESLVGNLDERGRRHWAAAAARSLGRGGITAVAQATGLSDRTVRTGSEELRVGVRLPQGRQRHAGGGRKAAKEKAPALLKALEGLVEPATRGDPQSPLKWTCKSTRELSKELKTCGHVVSRTTVAKLLKEAGSSLQANRKTIEGAQHPDRNAQFEHINRRVKAQRRAGQPALSVDTKKKENLGNYKNPGRTWRPTGQPLKVKTHDFPDQKRGKAVPYGVYDIGKNEAWVKVGISHDTAQFAVASIRAWWHRLGRQRYQPRRVQRLLITADGGGSNGPRNRLWKSELQELADDLGVAIEVCHFPPGTSKWNKIEHRVFCHITRRWRAQPLESYEIVVALIGATRTDTGLEVHATLDERAYPKGLQVSDADYATLNIKPAKFHGEWNYILNPRTKSVC
jgi:Rhodopirellula transposase DDE domain